MPFIDDQDSQPKVGRFVDDSEFEVASKAPRNRFENIKAAGTVGLVQGLPKEDIPSLLFKTVSGFLQDVPEKAMRNPNLAAASGAMVASPFGMQARTQEDSKVADVLSSLIPQATTPQGKTAGDIAGLAASFALPLPTGVAVSEISAPKIAKAIGKSLPSEEAFKASTSIIASGLKENFANLIGQKTREYGARLAKVLGDTKVNATEFYSNVVEKSLKNLGLIGENSRPAANAVERELLKIYSKFSPPEASKILDMTGKPVVSTINKSEIGADQVFKIERQLRGKVDYFSKTPGDKGHGAISEFMDNFGEYATELEKEGVNTGAIQALKSEFQPYLELKKQALKLLDPFNHKGPATADKLLRKVATGKAEPTEIAIVQQLEKYLGKQFLPEVARLGNKFKRTEAIRKALPGIINTSIIAGGVSVAGKALERGIKSLSGQ